MTEVHRYRVVTMLSAAGATIGYDPHGPEVVMASAFDEASRLFLDAAERCVAAERREKELQQRLTAADERADVLETALKKISVRCVAYIEAEREMPEPSVEVCQMIASAALKPAESSGKPCACTGCDSPRRANSPFCVAHRSAKSRTRGQDPLTADGLEWLMQNDGCQQ